MPSRAAAVTAIGPLSITNRRGPPGLLKRAAHALVIGPERRWRGAVGAYFLYTAANWGVTNWYLEVTMRDTSGKAMARLYDVTADAEVANSVVTDDGPDHAALERTRSSALTLVDGHQYRVEYGVQDGGGGRIRLSKADRDLGMV